MKQKLLLFCITIATLTLTGCHHDDNDNRDSHGRPTDPAGRPIQPGNPNQIGPIIFGGLPNR